MNMFSSRYNISIMNLFQGLFQGANVSNQRPGPTRINFFREYIMVELDCVYTLPPSPFAKTSKRAIRFCCLRRL
jgi:hypothetical protein